MDRIVALVQEALALDGLVWLLIAVLVAGLVRGFAGFGSAMIYMPIASIVLPPVMAIVMLSIMEFFGPLPNLPAAWRTGNRRDLFRMLIGAVIGLPIGIAILSQLDREVFGWIVSAVVLVLLPILMSGWRYTGPMTPPLLAATGGVGGLLQGAAGLAGPPVILLYMASAMPAATIRANFLMYLLSSSIMTICVALIAGLFSPTAVILGVLLAVPYMLANVLGAILFDPRAEGLYRGVAYLVIASSAVMGLPLFH